jgi:amidohydrolase
MSTTTSSPYKSVLEQHKPNLSIYESLYRHFHQNPEISTLEHETSAKIASHLKTLSPDLDIRTGIGGTGLIAICKNGPGPTVLLRADMDGLPVLEKTGLDYASTKTMKDTHLDNIIKPVMHACGHDMHIACNLAAADTLLRARQEWAGTVVFLFQPAEERAHGAQAMVDDGLYDPEKHACPIPDVVLGQHVFPLPPGAVVTKSGPMLAAADSWRITIYGRGGHGSMPHRCIDALVIAASIVVRLQTIVSREVPPDETAVVTVGSLNAGDTVNVIGDEAVMQVNVRTVSEERRKAVLDSIRRIVKAECDAGRSPKEPLFEKLHAFPLTLNDAAVTDKVGGSFKAHFGDYFDTIASPIPGSEDFQILASAVNRPSMFWAWSGTRADVWEKHKAEGTLDHLPVNHSPLFAPVIRPTLDIGIETMVVAALTFVGKS